jgi:UDP-N-acetylmuramate--alanine ligase
MAAPGEQSGIMNIFTRKKKFYFIGIGGVGMSGLAEILLTTGHAVSGSDRQKSELTDYLEKKGAVIYEGHDAENLHDADYVVYSSAIAGDNPEMQKARHQQIPLIRRAEMLGQFFNRKWGVAVSGTHGKTTTTSMVGQILLSSGLDPTIIVGGRLRNLMTNALLGKSDFLVAEADEYDRSFLALFPKITVITSVEADHMDIYSDLDDLRNTFIRFANQTTFDGSLILCWDDSNLRTMAKSMAGTHITYGFAQDAQFRAIHIDLAGTSSVFDVLHHGEMIGQVKLTVPGKHNVQNALAAIAVGFELGISIEKCQVGLGQFKGVERRFEIIGMSDKLMVVDDYAHHPTELRATLHAAKQGWKRRVVAVFQPHLFSRTRDFYHEFAVALSLADVAIVTGVYPAREAPIPGVSSELIMNELKRLKPEHSYIIHDMKEGHELLRRILQPEDMLITMGAGDIWKLGRQFV